MAMTASKVQTDLWERLLGLGAIGRGNGNELLNLVWIDRHPVSADIPGKFHAVSNSVHNHTGHMTFGAG